jgi:hypothetical protein
MVLHEKKTSVEEVAMDGGRNYQIKIIDLCDIHHYYQIDRLERETQGT